MIDIPYGRQCVDDDDIAAVVEVLRGDWLTQGPAVERFETALCSVTGARHAVAFANGTVSLHATHSSVDKRRMWLHAVQPCAAAQTASFSGS